MHINNIASHKVYNLAASSLNVVKPVGCNIELVKLLKLFGVAIISLLWLHIILIPLCIWYVMML